MGTGEVRSLTIIGGFVVYSAFAPTQPLLPKSDSPRVLIVGAGMSGILAAIKLIESGNTNFRIYEKADRVGGTWRDNTYPGLRCDVPAHMFTYSFEPNPDYSDRFPMGREIQSYLERVYDKYQLDRYICFNKGVESINFEDGDWYVQP